MSSPLSSEAFGGSSTLGAAEQCAADGEAGQPQGLARCMHVRECPVGEQGSQGEAWPQERNGPLPLEPVPAGGMGPEGERLQRVGQLGPVGSVAKVCLKSDKQIQSSHLWVEKV